MIIILIKPCIILHEVCKILIISNLAFVSIRWFGVFVGLHVFRKGALSGISPVTQVAWYGVRSKLDRTRLLALVEMDRARCVDLFCFSNLKQIKKEVILFKTLMFEHVVKLQVFYPKGSLNYFQIKTHEVNKLFIKKQV